MLKAGAPAIASRIADSDRLRCRRRRPLARVPLGVELEALVRRERPLGMTPRPAGISADGYAGRADVGSLAVTNVVTATRSADEAKARPTSAARPDVAGEIVAQLVDLDVQ